MCDSLRADLAGTGVEVTVVNPGYVRTPLTDGNEFDMPFLIGPEQAALAIADGLEAGKPEISFPLRMALAMKLLGSLPGPLSRRYTARLSKRLEQAEPVRRTGFHQVSGTPCAWHRFSQVVAR